MTTEERSVIDELNKRLRVELQKREGWNPKDWDCFFTDGFVTGFLMARGLPRELWDDRVEQV